MSTPTPIAVSAPAEPELNVTPLIDILLVLLTMLILTVPVLTHAVKLDLPLGGASAQPSSEIDVDIDRDGRVFWNGESVADEAALQQRFGQVAGALPQPKVNIWPDRRGRYERVVQVLAVAQRSGVSTLSLAPTQD
jgi:biopolymer transport protein ExbD